MKSLVVYYSHSGNTAYVVQRLLFALNKRGDAEIAKIKYARHARNLLMRLFYRAMPSLVTLEPIVTDLKDYDVVCFGIPVLGGHPSAAIVKYISICENLGKKKVVCCYVYGIELSAKRCAHYVERLLKQKGEPEIIKLFIPWTNVRNEELIDGVIEETLKNLDGNKN